MRVRLNADSHPAAIALQKKLGHAEQVDYPSWNVITDAVFETLDPTTIRATIPIADGLDRLFYGIMIP